jgi:hypothetical protein
LCSTRAGYSIVDPIGLVDVYVNGGSKQPGCHDPPLGAASGLLSFSCNHHRAPQIELFDFADHVAYPSLASCQPVAYRCPSYEQFQAGQCGTCGVNNGSCVLLGFWPNRPLEHDEHHTFPSKFYVNTLPGKPFCGKFVCTPSIWRSLFNSLLLPVSIMVSAALSNDG